MPKSCLFPIDTGNVQDAAVMSTGTPQALLSSKDGVFHAPYPENAQREQRDRQRKAGHVPEDGSEVPSHGDSRQYDRLPDKGG